ncbi:MAG: phenylalanine--tRNA ligase subunit beta [Deltaproteobacteria bacterium]|nr:phenylalanine--tRNA ligase subunit beta [Deltaproteobacteria bacterium]
MKISLAWLRELIDLPEPAAEVAERLTMTGFEVEAVHRAGAHLEGAVAGEVLEVRPHPGRPDMHVVVVADGVGRREVVCGAPNIPAPGGKTAYAPPGAKLGDVAVEARRLGGVESLGVLCSETDLGIGADASGLLVLPPATRPGASLHEVLCLHDHVLDVNVTPNRPDGLGHLGIARELGTIYRRPVCLPQAPPFQRTAREVDPYVRVDDPAGCPRYGAQVVRGLAVAPSPWAVRYRLHLLGVRAVSNLVDVTNLVLLLFSQPLHAFDLAKLRGGTIVVRRARDGETMFTLDGLERRFVPDDVLICDGEGPVAVAGVMGGLSSEIRDDTTDVLIECAHFDPPSIRRTSRRLGLSSESSYRFERGTDRSGVPRALAYAAGLMAELGRGRVCGEAIDAGGTGPDPAPVRLRPARVARIVGREFPSDEIRGTLERLGCRLAPASNGALDVVAPGWRPDLTREIDLVEEIARIGGYDALPGTPPTVTAGPRTQGNWEKLATLRRVLVARGLAETVNHVFADLPTLQAFGATEDQCVPLKNPLDAGRALLRTTLLPGLLGDARLAFAHRLPGAALFELGKTFHRRPGGTPGLPHETWRLGIVLAGKRIEGLAGNAADWDLYDLAAMLAAAADGALRRPWALRPAPDRVRWCHPRSACLVEIDGAEAGFAGELHPATADRLDVPRGAQVLELELTPERFRPEPDKVRELPRFPAVRRDLAAVFDETVTAGDVVADARRLGPTFLDEVSVFDVYRGEGIPAGRKSMAFALVYRHPERTLTEAEVETAHAGVVDGLVSRFGVTIRK